MAASRSKGSGGFAETSGTDIRDFEETQAGFSISSILGDRISAERRRLKFNGADFAKRCGVNPGSQSAYENGHRVPDAEYLARANAAGMDILYVLTGCRAPALVGEHGEQLQRIINLWPSLPEAARVALSALIEAITAHGGNGK